MYASVDAPYGDFVPVSMQQEYALLKSLGKIMPGQEVKLDGYGQETDSVMPAFDPTARGGLMESQQFETDGAQPPAAPGSPGSDIQSDKQYEVHMVYAEWCGHSQKSKPAFQELVNGGDILTNGGSQVKFVMTEEQDEGMAMFQGKIQGFPTYMTVTKQGGEVVNMEELNVSDRSAEAITAAAKELV